MLTKKQLNIRIGAALKSIQNSVKKLRVVAYDIEATKTTKKFQQLADRRISANVALSDANEKLRDLFADLMHVSREEIQKVEKAKAEDKLRKAAVKKAKADAKQAKVTAKAEKKEAKKVEKKASKAAKFVKTPPIAAWPFPSGPDKEPKKAKLETKAKVKSAKAGKTISQQVADGILGTSHKPWPAKKAKKGMTERQKIEARIKILNDNKAWLDEHTVYNHNRKLSRIRNELKKLNVRLSALKSKKPKASGFDHDKMANTGPGSAVAVMTAVPSERDTPMGALQADGGAY